MPRAIRGVLIECDPSIKSIIVNIDSANHEYIIEDLDDQRVVVKENMVGELKRRLEEVRGLLALFLPHAHQISNQGWPPFQRLAETQQPAEESGSE